eukprot:13134492-Heterocapsa_arctica.AAC.1
MAPSLMSRRICPASAGASAIPDMLLFLSEVIASARWKRERRPCCILQNLHVPWAGAPAHIFPRSFGRFANAPHLMQNHLCMPRSTTLRG